MKKIDLGQMITILANVGVIVGIVFLAVEVRHARTATELQTIEDLTDGWVSLNEGVVHDPVVARTWIVGLYEPERLTALEATQFSMHVRMFINQVNRVEQHRNLGLVSERDHQFALQQLATILDTPGGRLWAEGEPGIDEDWMQRLEPYAGQRPAVNLLLDRNPSSVE